MAADMGFSRRTSSERDLQPVAIIAVDPLTRTATGVTRTRHTLRINCAYATGDTITIPAAGEQWYCERFEMEWRLYGRIPFNDPTLNIKPEEGQVSVGSASGPLELNGTEVRANGAVFRLNGVYYRDSGTALERSTDQQTWTPIVPGDVAGILQVVAKTLADFTGSTEAGAITALTEWGDTVDEVLRNFGLFWDLICGNVFVSGLRRLGVGDTEVAKIVDGFQNFVNYLFGIVFCDFTGDLTPQTLLARLRDLLAPIINNPFVQGLQQIAEILGVAVGNLLNDVVAGLTGLFELVLNIVFCRWDLLASQLTNIAQIIGLVDEDSPFSPANIVKQLVDFFSFLGLPEINGIPNPVGIFFSGLAALFTALTGSESSGSVLQDAIQGGVGFVQLIFRIISCDTGALDDLAALIADALPEVGDPLGLLAIIGELITAILANPLVVMVQDFLTTLFPDLVDGTLITQLLEGASNLVHLLIKVVTSILPFRDLWETLLPFVDWNKVDEMEAVLPDATSFFVNGITDLWKMLFKPLDDLIKLIVAGAGETPFTDFIENIANLFAPVGAFFADPAAFLEDLAQEGLASTVIQNILAALRIGVFDASGVFSFIEDLGANIEQIATGLFGQAASVVKAIFDGVVSMFGGTSVFTSTGGLDFVALATNFFNNVLNNIPNLFLAMVEGVNSLVYKIANGIIEAIRGFPFGLGVGLADTLQALLNGFVNFGRGTVKSGSNLLADPGAEIAAFWTQADATRDTTVKRSAGASLRVTSGGATQKEFWFNIDDLGSVASIDTDTGEVNYAECYVLYPTTYTVSGVPTANAGTSGTVTLVAKYYDSTGTVTSTPELTATASMGKSNTSWVKLSGNFTTPTTGVANTQYDRVDFGFRLVGGQTTSDARFYVDDMLVREISAAQSATDDVAATNTNLYGSASRPASNAQIRDATVPVLSGATGRTKVPELQTTIDSINQGFLGGSGTGNAASTVLTRLQGLNQNLWGLNTLGSTIKDAATPVVSNITQGWRNTPYGGFTSTNARETADAIRQAAATLSDQVAKLKSTSGGSVASGNSASVSFSGYSTISGAGFSPVTVANDGGLTISNGAATFTGFSNPASVRAIYAAKTATSIYQKVAIVFAGMDDGRNYIYARMNSNATAYIYAWFQGATIEIGYNAGGGEVMLGQRVYSGNWINLAYWAGGTYWLECGVNNNPGTYRVLSGDAPVLTVNDISNRFTSGPAGTPDYRWTGFGGTSNGSNKWAAPIGAFAFYDNETPAYVGSGFRISRTSGTVSFPTTGTGTSGSNPGTRIAAVFPNTTFGATPEYITDEYTWDTNSEGVTVKVAGWYQVSVGAGLNSVTGSGFFFTVGVRKNGTNVAMGNDGGPGTWNASCSTIVYCAKNDVLYPVYLNNFTAGVPVVGDAAGAHTYFSVSFLNNSAPVVES